MDESWAETGEASEKWREKVRQLDKVYTRLKEAAREEGPFETVDQFRAHWVYKSILALGPSVISLMLRDIEIDREFLKTKAPERFLQSYPWFAMIQILSGDYSQSPVWHLYDPDLVVQDYLDWGILHGYI
jgi:hypothetical protein